MAEYTEKGRSITRVASGSLEGSQFTFVRQLGQLDVLTVAVSGSFALGVLQNKPRDNEHANVVIDGQTKIRLANSLGAGSYVMAGNSGFAVLAGSNQVVMGYLIQGATSGALATLQIDRSHTGSL